MADAPFEPTPPVEGPPPADGTESDAPPLSWAEQELIDSLKRLARAQSQLQQLEEQVATQAPSFDPDDEARLRTLHDELTAARGKASGRFGKGAARERVHDLELSEGLLLERMGLATFEDYQARSDGSARAAEPVDPAVLAFARQELASARSAWLEVQAMSVPEDDPAETDPDPGEEPEASGGTGQADTIRLDERRSGHPGVA